MPFCGRCETRLPGKPGNAIMACPSASADEEGREQYVFDVEWLENEFEADRGCEAFST